MAHRGRLAAVAVSTGLAVACGGAGGSAGGERPESAAIAPPRPPSFATDEEKWGRFHSKRFQLSVPLPDGHSWKIDDHSGPALVAVHPSTSSRLSLTITREDELQNRERCEKRARDLGWVPDAPLSTVEDETVLGPDAYDSRIWVALHATNPGGAVDGHVFLFGGFLRRCLIVHFSTRVASAKDEDVLSSRLAIARARILRGITLDPPRTTDDASVPRDRPDIRR